MVCRQVSRSESWIQWKIWVSQSGTNIWLIEDWLRTHSCSFKWRTLSAYTLKTSHITKFTALPIPNLQVVDRLLQMKDTALPLWFSEYYRDFIQKEATICKTLFCCQNPWPFSAMLDNCPYEDCFASRFLPLFHVNRTAAGCARMICGLKAPSV